jgi:hypothetical protein
LWNRLVLFDRVVFDELRKAMLTYRTQAYTVRPWVKTLRMATSQDNCRFHFCEFEDLAWKATDFRKFEVPEKHIAHLARFWTIEYGLWYQDAENSPSRKLR